MKIYTKTGDTGETSLYGGERVPKNDLRLEVYGTLDELNACLGLALTKEGAKEYQSIILDIQNDLFAVGSELASLGKPTPANLKLLSDDALIKLEQMMDELTKTLPPLTNFILPGGTALAAYLHLARTVCRRAERVCVKLNQVQKIRPLIMCYLNRLSDFLFLLARQINHQTVTPEIIWQGK